MARQNEKKKQSIQNLHKELGADAEFDGDDDDDEYTLLRIKRDCARRVVAAAVLLVSN